MRVTQRNVKDVARAVAASSGDLKIKVSGSDGKFPEQGTVISETPDGTPLTSQNTLQFYNAEEAGSTILHSAYGFGKGFPNTPFSFPSPAPSPTGSAIAQANWFTGRIASPSDTICYSQTFTLATGTYYFGDYDLYNTIAFRDVVIF